MNAGLTELVTLFAQARVNPKLVMNDPYRLQGKHCQARLQRAQAKRRKAGRAVFNPR